MVSVKYQYGSLRPIRTKFIKNALSTATVRVDQVSHIKQDEWRQVDLINPRDTNLVMVCGIAEHPTLNMNEGFFYYHQLALCIEGEMVVHDLANGNVYRAHEGDLYYWAPGHRQMLGGKFKAFFVKTPVPTRWVIAPNGKQGVPMFELVDETIFEASPPDEVREVHRESLDTAVRPRMKFVRRALKAEPIHVSDNDGPMNAWSQVDLINAPDSDLVVVAGIAEHPTEDGYICDHRRHQVALILDGEMDNEDLDTGVVYKAHKGDLLYWPPGLVHRVSGKFRAYFVQTPTNRRWIKTSEGSKRLDLLNLEGEAVYEASAPDEVRKERLTQA